MVVVLVLQEQTLDVGGDGVVRGGGEEYLSQNRDTVGKISGHEHVEASQVKSVGVSMKIGSVVANVSEEAKLHAAEGAATSLGRVGNRSRRGRGRDGSSRRGWESGG